MTTRNTLVATIAVIVLVLIGLYFITKGPATAPAPASSATATSTTATSTSLTLAQPNYMQPIAFSSSLGLSPQIESELNQELATVQGQLKANPLNMGAWVNLGTIHEQGGDYTAAATYWEYVVSIYEAPDSPYYNLGDLYQNYLHNDAKAETDYQMAIKVNPSNAAAYVALAGLYQSEGKYAQASSTIAAGLKVNPGNTYLESFQ